MIASVLSAALGLRVTHFLEAGVGALLLVVGFNLKGALHRSDYRRAERLLAEVRSGSQIDPFAERPPLPALALSLIVFLFLVAGMLALVDGGMAMLGAVPTWIIMPVVAAFTLWPYRKS